MKPIVQAAIAAIAVLVLVTYAAPASAGISAQRAICSVRLAPGTSEGLGKSGGLVISTKARYEHCGNSFEPLEVHLLCTALPTSSSCTADARFHYTEAALLAVYHALVEARHALDTVDVFFEGVQSNRGQQIRVGAD